MFFAVKIDMEIQDSGGLRPAVSFARESRLLSGAGGRYSVPDRPSDLYDGFTKYRATFFYSSFSCCWGF